MLALTLPPTPLPFIHTDLVAKGNAGYNFQGGANNIRGPNAAGVSAYRPSAMQPRSNNMQRLEAHFNGGRRTVGHVRLDDSPLDALGGARASSSVANEVRGHPYALLTQEVT